MKKYYLLCLIVLLAACKEEKGIRIKTATSRGTGKKAVRTDTISFVNTDYFEVNLNSVRQGKYYIATRDLKKPRTEEDFGMSFLTIVKENGEAEEFADATAFLNFMSQHGYEAAGQHEKKFSTHYTFKQK